MTSEGDSRKLPLVVWQLPGDGRQGVVVGTIIVLEDAVVEWRDVGLTQTSSAPWPDSRWTRSQKSWPRSNQLGSSGHEGHSGPGFTSVQGRWQLLQGRQISAATEEAKMTVAGNSQARQRC